MYTNTDFKLLKKFWSNECDKRTFLLYAPSSRLDYLLPIPIDASNPFILSIPSPIYKNRRSGNGSLCSRDSNRDCHRNLEKDSHRPLCSAVYHPALEMACHWDQHRKTPLHHSSKNLFITHGFIMYLRDRVCYKTPAQTLT